MGTVTKEEFDHLKNVEKFYRYGSGTIIPDWGPFIRTTQ
jgi:hypothetical protein